MLGWIEAMERGEITVPETPFNELRMLTAIRRVDQKYGPFDEFSYWREQAQGMVPREEVMDNGELRFTDDPWRDVDLETRMEQDNEWYYEHWQDDA